MADSILSKLFNSYNSKQIIIFKSSNAIQAASRKLMEMDLLTIEEDIYYIPDILFRMYIQKLKDSNLVFF